MKFLRNNEFKKKVLWFVTIIIILSFGVFGTAYLVVGNQNRTPSAGAIFGRKIKLPDFLQEEKMAEVQAMMHYGDNYSKVRAYLNLDTETWGRLILLHEAKRRRIKISNDQVIKAIENLPYFQRNKQFDTLIYKDVLSYVFKIRARDFEEGVRNNLKIARIFDDVTKDITVSNEAVFAAFKKQHEATQVFYVLIKPDAYVDPSKYNAQDARLYWAEHKEDFVTPSSINVSYVDFPYPKDADEKAEDAVKKDVQAFIAKLKEGGDFDKVAKDNGKTVKTTGFFSKENPDLSLGWSFDMLNKLFPMKKGQMAGPFTLEDRLVVVSLADKKDSYVPTYDEVKDKVKTAYLKDAAKETTRKKAEEYLSKMKTALATKTFAQAAESLGLQVQETPSFTRGEYLPKIGISKEFETAAFSLNDKQKLSSVVAATDGFAILYLDKYTPVSQEEFKKEKDKVEASVLQERKNTAFNEFMTQLRLKAHLYDNVNRMRKAQEQEEQQAQAQ